MSDENLALQEFYKLEEERLERMKEALAEAWKLIDAVITYSKQCDEVLGDWGSFSRWMKKYGDLI